MPNPQSSAPACGTCRWWGGHISGRVYDPGPCRRYPPIRFGNGDHLQHRPIMSPDDFCGEHTPLRKVRSMVDYMQKAREALNTEPRDNIDNDYTVSIRIIATTLEALDKAEGEYAKAHAAIEQLTVLLANSDTRADKAEAEIARLRARLEIPEPPFDTESCDGISCRDDTIKLLDARIRKAEAERDALRQFVAVFARDSCACGIAINKPCLPCKARALIQPEPDPFAVAIAEANESYLAGTGDLADHIRASLARHGLAVKEVG